MKDRIPADGRAGRIKITNGTIQGTVVDGVLTITGVEGVFEFDDGAEQNGSVYNKANVLPENVCNLLGFENDGDSIEPKDAFARIAENINNINPSPYEKFILTGRFF